MTRKEAVDREHFFQLSLCQYNLRDDSTKRARLVVRKFGYNVE